MLRVDLAVMLIMDLSLVIVAQHSPFQFHGFAYAVQVTSVHVCDDHYLMRSKFNSLLTEMITPQTYHYIYIYIHIKPLPVSRVFGARSGLPRIMDIILAMKRE